MKNNTKRICTLAMLIAIAFILGTFSIRIGAGIKISFKFLAVFLASVLYGPFGGGICGALSDVLSYFLNPGFGALIPAITFVEFLYGVSFGLFFYKAKGLSKANILKVFICIILNSVILGIFAMSYALKDLMGLSYINMVIYRIPSTALNTFFHIAGLLILLKLLPRFEKYIQ